MISSTASLIVPLIQAYAKYIFLVRQQNDKHSSNIHILIQGAKGEQRIVIEHNEHDFNKITLAIKIVGQVSIVRCLTDSP